MRGSVSCCLGRTRLVCRCVCFDSRNQDVKDVHNRGRSRESRHRRTHEEGQIESIDVNRPPMINRLCLAKVENGEIRERKTECIRCLKAKAQG